MLICRISETSHKTNILWLREPQVECGTSKYWSLLENITKPSIFFFTNSFVSFYFSFYHSEVRLTPVVCEIEKKIINSPSPDFGKTCVLEEESYGRAAKVGRRRAAAGWPGCYAPLSSVSPRVLEAAGSQAPSSPPERRGSGQSLDQTDP